MIGINCNVEKGNLGKAVELLYFLVRRGGVVIKKKREGHNNNSKFYDEECMNKRKELRNKFKKWRRDNDEVSRLEYVDTKKQYRIL